MVKQDEHGFGYCSDFASELSGYGMSDGTGFGVGSLSGKGSCCGSNDDATPHGGFSAGYGFEYGSTCGRSSVDGIGDG